MEDCDKTVVRRVRMASGISKKEASEITGFKCVQPYSKRECDPDKFTIGEFFKFYGHVDGFAKQWLWEFIEQKKNAS